MTKFSTEIKQFKELILSLEKNYKKIELFQNQFIETLINRKKLIFCGNGGSAADSLHFAAEFTGRFNLERKSLNAISIASDIASITSIANDYGYENVFSRQLEGIGNKGDILVSFSTSGNSENILKAVNYSNGNGLKTFSFSGKGGGELKNISNECIIIDSNITARIQEGHKFIMHYICNSIDEYFQNNGQ